MNEAIFGVSDFARGISIPRIFPQHFVTSDGNIGEFTSNADFSFEAINGEGAHDARMKCVINDAIWELIEPPSHVDVGMW